MANDNPAFSTASTLPQLYEMLDGVQMKNGWNKPTPSLYPEPKQVFVPARWKYQHARAALHKAGDLVDPQWAERRNLIMANPIPGNDYPTVTTLVGAYQMVKPGKQHAAIGILRMPCALLLKPGLAPIPLWTELRSRWSRAMCC